MTNLIRKEEGQGLVEFALVLPILLMLVCGIIDFGWLFYNQLSLQNACREGARYACVHSSDDDVATKVHDKVEDNIPGSLLNGLSVVVHYSNDANPTEGEVTITVQSKMRILTPVMGVFYAGQQKDMKSSVTMKVES